MKRLHTLCLALCFAGGCQGELYEQATPDGGIKKQTCPSGQSLQCLTDPDTGEVCTCQPEAFDPCEKYPQKVCAPMPVPPDGGSDWQCTWSELDYTCTSENGSAPMGGGGWTCLPDSEGGATCTRDNVPVPPGGGGWTCYVDNDNDVLVCEKKPDGKTTWSCQTGADGKQVCTSSGGLPAGGGTWTCHMKDGSWVCTGTTGGVPPGGGGWTCVKLKTELGEDIYRCTKPGADTPDGSGNWTCLKSSELGGTKCEEGPPGLQPEVGGKCVIDSEAWCDGHTYCGWGKVACDPTTGTWATEVKDGKVRLKCYEVNDLRPNTVCACYHTFFNKDCCERADCIIPPGTKGQVCSKSPGKLCDYCSPLKPECTEPGGKCLVTNSGETFCGRTCSTNQPCPAGYICKGVKVSGTTVMQCAPADMSCYY